MRKHSLLLALAAASLAGCSTLDTALSNRVTCAVAKDEAFVISLYGRVGPAYKIAPQDAEVICRELEQ